MNFDNFCKKFDIEKIKSSQLFETAITHSSVSKKQNYERLEFLGDSILNFIISDILYNKFPKKNEGDLAKFKSFIVSGEICHIIAKEIGIETISKVHKIEHQNNNILSNIMESIIALIYITYGMNKIYNMINELFIPYLKNFEEDSKMQLQEYSQKIYKCLPKYELILQSGTEHEPIFTIQVSILNKKSTAIGRNKKDAEKLAAKQLMQILMQN